jgi:hypothetical protein
MMIVMMNMIVLELFKKYQYSAQDTTNVQSRTQRDFCYADKICYCQRNQ